MIAKVQLRFSNSVFRSFFEYARTSILSTDCTLYWSHNCEENNHTLPACSSDGGGGAANMPRIPDRGEAAKLNFRPDGGGATTLSLSPGGGGANTLSLLKFNRENRLISAVFKLGLSTHCGICFLCLLAITSLPPRRKDSPFSTITHINTRRTCIVAIALFMINRQ